MGWWSRMTGGAPAEHRAGNPLERDTVSLSADAGEVLQFFGLANRNIQLPVVTIETALGEPAVFSAVMFLSRSLASLPLHSYRKKDGEAARIDGELQMLLNEAPNPEWTSFGWRQYMWQQAFTGGRGLTWIERAGEKVVALWPMDPTRTTVRRQGGRKIYRFDSKEYPAADVIDVPFALKTNQLDAYSPISKCADAIALSIAMRNYAATFFAGGGVPPLALEGPLPQGADAFKRAMADIRRAIDLAKKASESFFGIPPGHSLKPIGVDPSKGQMVEARRFQLEEIARIYQMPPIFLQDLTNGTMANTEQQDLQLVKHIIVHWTSAFEDELNLKLFGQRRRARYVEHSLDGMLRGDLKSRIDAMARGIQTGQLTPNEARALDNRPPMPEGDKLYVQGATVPLGTVLNSKMGHNGGPPLNDPATEPAADPAQEPA